MRLLLHVTLLTVAAAVSAKRFIVLLDRDTVQSTISHRKSVIQTRIEKEWAAVTRTRARFGPAAQVLPGIRDSNITAEFSKALKGYAVDVPDTLESKDSEYFRELYASLDGVVAVEEDDVGMLQPAVISGRVVTQQNVSSQLWALDRISARDNRTLDGVFEYAAQAGEGVVAWVIDSGVDTAHSEFKDGRAQHSRTCVDGGNDRDESGHGTHVAAIIAGASVGVARKATVRAVKAFAGDGTGLASSVLCAYEHVLGEIRREPAKTHVLNLSFGFDAFSVAMERALTSIADEPNVVVFVAAGNDAKSACSKTPARLRHKAIMTVAAASKLDARAETSNYGDCVHVYAPGAGIYSAEAYGEFIYKTGTSMSTPFAAGVAALHIGMGATSGSVMRAIKEDSVNVAAIDDAPLLQYKYREFSDSPLRAVQQKDSSTPLVLSVEMIIGIATGAAVLLVAAIGVRWFRRQKRLEVTTVWGEGMATGKPPVSPVRRGVISPSEYSDDDRYLLDSASSSQLRGGSAKKRTSRSTLSMVVV